MWVVRTRGFYQTHKSFSCPLRVFDTTGLPHPTLPTGYTSRSSRCDGGFWALKRAFPALYGNDLVSQSTRLKRPSIKQAEDVYESRINPEVVGNGGRVFAEPSPLHGFGHSAALVLPANSVLVFAR